MLTGVWCVSGDKLRGSAIFLLLEGVGLEASAWAIYDSGSASQHFFCGVVELGDV
jgi:hypothetical protein